MLKSRSQVLPQARCAIEEGLDFIITRNIKDFKDLKIKALLLEDFLAMAGF